MQKTQTQRELYVLVIIEIFLDFYGNKLAEYSVKASNFLAVKPFIFSELTQIQVTCYMPVY